MNAGKWLIIGIFSVAIASGLGAWVHRYYRTDEVQKIWGTKTLDLIANAPVVESTEPGRLDPVDITAAKGTLSIRYMLASDFSYGVAINNGESTDKYWTLTFKRSDESVQFVFSRDCVWMFEESTGTGTKLVSAAAANLRSFFEEQFPDQTSK